MIIVIIFVGATFFTQITMLNMLIAIMGDTFDRAMENRIRFGISSKLDILKSQSALISQVDKKESEEVFMIVVRPLEMEEDGEDDWEGTVKKIAKVTDESNYKLE